MSKDALSWSTTNFSVVSVWRLVDAISASSLDCCRKKNEQCQK